MSGRHVFTGVSAVPPSRSSLGVFSSLSSRLVSTTLSPKSPKGRQEPATGIGLQSKQAL